MTTFLNQLPLDIENIILDYKFELEHEDRVEEHKEKFGDCLDFIEDFNLYIHQDINDEVLINITEDPIEIVFDELSMSIPNINKWYPSHEEMITDLLLNFQRSSNYENFEDFVEELGIEDEGDEEEVEKFQQWWESMIIMAHFVMKVLQKKYKVMCDTNSFLEYCEEL